jgi:hypothetical protein
VLQAAIVVIRAVAVSHDSTLDAIPEEIFGTVAATRALPGEIVGGLSRRLGAALAPMDAPEGKLRDAIGRPAATVQSTAQAVL